MPRRVHTLLLALAVVGAFAGAAIGPAAAQGRGGQTPPPNYPPPVEGDYIARDFHFTTGEALPELKLHYRTLGTPHADSVGIVRNAVLVLHGTGGNGGGFLSPTFAGQLFGPGQLLDATKYFIVLPDG